MYYSQLGQDEFVLQSLDFKKYGTFVEIGAYHSTEISNTYILEKEYSWRGVAIEIMKDRAIEYNQNRITKCIQADATKLDYSNLFESFHMPKQIDYLQIDIDPAYQSLEALKSIPFDKYRFSVITFEHDLWRTFSQFGAEEPGNIKIKEESQKILSSYGYFLAKENITDQVPVEDWWIDPTAI